MALVARGSWLALALVSLVAQGCGGAAQKEPASPPAQSVGGADGASPAPSSAPSVGAAPTGKPQDEGDLGSATAQPMNRSPEPIKNDGGGSSNKPGAESPKPLAAQALAGKLTDREVRATLERNFQHFDGCYAHVGSTKVKGKVTAKITIGPSGDVSEAKLVDSSFKQAKFNDCVLAAFKKIRFTAPDGGATGVFTVPVDFEADQLK
jgi:TonB family protein